MEDLKNQIKDDIIGEYCGNVAKQILDLGKDDCKNDFHVKIDNKVYDLEVFLSEIRQGIIGKDKDVKDGKEILENKDFKDSKTIFVNLTEKSISKVVQAFNQTEHLRKNNYPDKEAKSVILSAENMKFLDTIKEGLLDKQEKYFGIGTSNKYTQNQKPNPNSNQNSSNNPNQNINPSPNNYNLTTQSRISSSNQPPTSTNTATLLSSKRKKKPETYCTKDCLFIKKANTNASNPQVSGLIVSQPPQQSQMMIQCDGHCKTWFHSECVGLNDQRLREFDTFGTEWFCKSCLKKYN